MYTYVYTWGFTAVVVVRFEYNNVPVDVNNPRAYIQKIDEPQIRKDLDVKHYSEDPNVKGIYYAQIVTNQFPLGKYLIVFSGEYNGEILTKEVSLLLISPREPYTPSDLISQLRYVVGDTDPDGNWVFSDNELEYFLFHTLRDFNYTPPFTRYTWRDLPREYYGLIIEGAAANALFALATKYAPRPVEYSQKGLRLSGATAYNQIRQLAVEKQRLYEQKKNAIKASMINDAFILRPDVPPTVAYLPYRLYTMLSIWAW